MKKIIVLMMIFLMLPLAYSQDDGEEDEAGAIGPEHGFLHAFDIVADNIVAFLSRIGGEETHANVVRRIVAERRAEHLRLLTLKNSGEITAQEFAKMTSSLQKHIDKKEAEQKKAEQAVEQKKAEKAASASSRESTSNKPSSAGTRPSAADKARNK